MHHFGPAGRSMMVCYTIRTDKKLQMSNKYEDLLYLVLEPRNEIGGSLSRTGLKKGVNFMRGWNSSATPELLSKFPI